MQQTSYDVIVLGLGAMGSAAAYHLARAGKRVLALEQYELDHQKGSSYGESRIIRYAYDHPAYIEMAKASFPLWHEVEADSGKSLLVQTGGLDFGLPDDPHFAETRRSLDVSGIQYDWLTPQQVSERLPQFTLQVGEMGIYQPDAGFLRASQCVITQAERARELGATLLTDMPVMKIDVLSDSVRVHTVDAHYDAGALVITAGPWAARVLDGIGLTLPLQPTREILVYFDSQKPEWFGPERCPIFIYHGARLYYGIANPDGVSGFKVAQHGRHEPTQPDTINRVTEDSYIAEVREFLRRSIPWGDGRVVKSYVCMYTMTPDEHFIIDQHPQHKHVAIGAGFSGHGFKFSTLIGKLLGELATAGRSDYDLDLFRLSRFL